MPFVSDVLDPTGGTIDMLAMQAEHWDGNERLPGRPSVAAKDNIHVHLFIYFIFVWLDVWLLYLFVYFLISLIYLI